MDKIILHIEELSLNAWAPLQTMLLDGWVLRFANGYTKRANSINPLYASADDINKKIDACEQIYRGKSLPVVFKISPAVYPENLDAILESRGYFVDSPTSVQMMDLNETAASSNAVLSTTLTEGWLANFCQMSEITNERQITLRKIFDNIIPQKCFAMIQRDGQVIACGMGVQQGEYIGYFDIIANSSFRNQGYGKQLMHSLLTWGKQNGSQKAYLQVMLNNAPALHLYSQLGFKETYQYWYRIKQ